MSSLYNDLKCDKCGKECIGAAWQYVDSPHACGGTWRELLPLPELHSRKPQKLDGDVMSAPSAANGTTRIDGGMWKAPQSEFLMVCDRCGRAAEGVFTIGYSDMLAGRPCMSKNEHDILCDGYWREVKRGALTTKVPIPEAQLIPDQQETARQSSWKNYAVTLERECDKLREENAPQRGEIAKLEMAVDCWAKENARLKEAWARDRDEIRRLKMQLADHAALKRGADALAADALRELDFCKREIARLDPRLAAARWGRK